MRTCLDRLETTSIIRTCDPDIGAARIKRTGRRPKAHRRFKIMTLVRGW